MFFNSRSVAFLLSVIICFATGTSLSFYDVSFEVVFVTLIISFSVSFTLCFLVFELLVFKEFRRINRVFSQFSSKSEGGDVFSELPVKRISTELLTFANRKEEEIEKLKKLELFRREFLADISHELKTPVFAAQGFIHTLLDGAIEDVKFRDRFLKKSAKALDQLDNLIHDLIVISQLETGEIKMQMEDVDLTVLVQDIFDILDDRAHKRSISLVFESFLNPDVLVKADYQRLGQVFKNLIVNAILYGNEGGEIRVILKQKVDKVLVSVVDDGPGIPQEHQKRLFQRFYRIEKSRSKEMGGTGLGLSIVKHIVEAHGSEIILQSKVGKGATFSFSLASKELQE